MHSSISSHSLRVALSRHLLRAGTVLAVAASMGASSDGCEQNYEPLPQENELKGSVHVQATLRDDTGAIGTTVITDASHINVRLERASQRIPEYGTSTSKGFFQMTGVELDRYQARVTPTPQHEVVSDWLEVTRPTVQVVEFPTALLIEPHGTVESVPNPSSQEVTIRFDLTVAGETEVYLARFHPSRQPLHTLYDGFLAAGTHEMLWDGVASNVTYPLQGAYAVIVKQGEQYQYDVMIWSVD